MLFRLLTISLALWAVTIAEIIVFTLCGALMYHFIGWSSSECCETRTDIHFPGNQYITAPAFGSLQPVFKKIAFSFAIPTIIFLGSLYSVSKSTLLCLPLLTSFVVCQRPLRFLPHLPQFEAPSFKYASWLDCLVQHRRGHLDLRVHYRGSYSVLL